MKKPRERHERGLPAFEKKTAVLLIAAVLLFSATGAFGAAGFWKQFVIMNYGGADQYYGNPMSSGFNGVNLGSYAFGGSIWLDGAQAWTYENGGDWVTPVYMYYRITNTTYGTEGWSQVNLANIYTSGADREWEKADVGRKLSTNAAGTYYIEVYFQAQGNWSGGNWQFYDSAAPDYKAYFTITNLPVSADCWVTNDAGPESMTMNWTRPSPYNVMIVRRAGAWPEKPTNGVAYTLGQSYGNANQNLIVYASGDGNTAKDMELSANPGFDYYYLFYTENYSYYSVLTGTVYSGRTLYKTTPPFRTNEFVDSFATFPGYIGDRARNTGRGWTNAWGDQWGNIYIDANSLMNAPNYPTPWGHKVKVDPGINGSGGAKRSFAPITTGTFYLAWIMNVGSPGTERYAGLDVVDSAGSAKYMVGLPGNRTNVAVQRSSDYWTGDSNYEIQPGKDYTIISKYDFSTHLLSIIAYYTNATIPLTEPTTWNASLDLGAGYISTISRVSLSGGGWGSTYDIGDVFWDEVRIGKNWKELLGQVEPTWDGQGANGNWDSITNWVGDYLPAATTNVTFYDSILSGTNILANGAMRTVNGLRINDNADTSLNLIPDGSAANHLTINGGGVAISTGSAGSHILGYVTLGANQTWTNDSAQTFSITNRIRGTGNLTKTGAGTVLLNHGTTSNDFTGTVTVNNGPLRIVKAASLAGVAAGTTVNSGGALELAPNSGTTYPPEPLTLSGTGVANGGALRSINYNNTWSGPITLGAATRINCDANSLTLNNATAIDEAYGLTFGGAGEISNSTPINTGANIVTKDGAGRLTLSGSSGYTGLTTINEGVIRVAHQYGLGWLATGTTVSNGTALELIGGITIDEPLTLSGTGISSGGALRNLSGNTTFGGAITLASATRINSDSGQLQLGANADISGAGINLTVGGAGVVDIWGNLPTGAATYTKDGTGTNTLNNMSATRTWTGVTTISAGMLQVTGLNGLSSNSAVTVSSGATLDLAAGAAVGSIAGAGTLSGGGALIAGGNNTSTTFSGPMTGGGALTKVGTGTLTLSGTSTRSGNTTVTVGTLIQNGTNASSPVTVSSGAFLYGGGEVQNLTINGRASAGTASNMVGALKASWLMLENNGTLQVELSAMTGTAGVNWDVVNASGALLVNAADGSDFVIALKGSPAFNNTVGYTNTIMTSANLSSFATNKFTIVTTEFTPSLDGGSFAVNQDGNNIRIIFTPSVASPPVPWATSYTVGVANAVSDGQITSGAFAVSMNFEDSVGMTTNANYDLVNTNGIVILTNEQFTTKTFQNSGTRLVASDNAHWGFYPGDLGTYTGRWSALDSNALWTTDSTTLSNGTKITFTVSDDDTTAPVVPSFGTINLLNNPGFEIGSNNGSSASGWWDSGAYPDSAARQWKYAFRSGTNGIAWGSWATGAWGFFGQAASNTLTQLNIGDVVDFRIWAFCENNFTSSTKQAYIELKFLTNDVGGDASLIATNRFEIYDTLVSQRGAWQLISLSVTCSVANVNVIKPVIGYGDAVDSGTLIGMSVFWDDAVLTKRTAEPLQVYIGNTKYTGSDATTNALFYIHSGALTNLSATNSLRLVFGAYDSGSGLARGTSDTNRNMNVDVGRLCTNNTANYSSGDSTADGTLSTATSTWRWITISAAELTGLTNAVTNKITVTIFDEDVDRSNDQLSVMNQQFGYLVVTNIAPFADMAVLGTNLAEIVNDDITPTTADGTDFGAMIGATPWAWTNTFTITNTGNANLTLQNVALRTNVGAAGVFSIGTQLTNLTLGAAAATTFKVKFSPTNAGVYQAIVTITNSTSFKNPYAFLIRATYYTTAPTYPEPTAISATADGNEMIRLAWTKNASYNVMITYRATNTPTLPVQGTSYTNGQWIGTDGTRVIYQPGPATNLEHVAGDGQNHYYRFFSTSNNMYSTGTPVSVSTASYTANEIVEPGAYTNQTSLSGGVRGHGWTNGWTMSSNLGVPIGYSNVLNQLAGIPTFADMPAYPNRAANRILLANPGPNAWREAYRNFAPISTGVVYMSGMFTFENKGGNKWVGFSAVSGSTHLVSFGETIMQDASLGVWDYGSSSNLAADTLSTWGVSTGNSYLVIAKYDFATRYFSVTKYYRTETVPEEPATWPISVQLPAGYMNSINGMGIKAGCSASGQGIGDCYFDELRVTTTWPGAPSGASTGRIYDGFAASSGDINGGTGGTGWSNAWSETSTYADYTGGSFSTGVTSYADVTGNKVVFWCDVDGRWISADRTFAQPITSGKFYMSWMQNYGWNGVNKWAGLSFMDGTTEKAFIGKMYSGDKALGIDSSSDNRISSTNMENGAGNDYIITAMYDFSTRELSATFYKIALGTNGEMIAEQPTGYWYVTTTQTVGHITRISGVRLTAGSAAGANVGAVYFDELRGGTNWFEVNRAQGELYSDQMANGPTPKLLFVGTNYNPALNPQGAAGDITITDAELVNIADKVDFALLWTNTWGVFITNNNGRFNISSRSGRVNPNWDPLTKAGSGATNFLNMDTNFHGIVGYNGAMAVTTYVQNAFSITNSTVGDTYLISVSAENNNTDGGFIDAPNTNDAVPIRRAITVNSQLVFTVTDDDSTPPALTTPSIGMSLGGTNIGNLLTDSGFDNATPWVLYSIDSAKITNSAGEGGGYGVLFKQTTAGGPPGNTNDHGGFYQEYVINGNASRRYLFTVRGREGPDDFDCSQIMMKFEFYNSANSLIYYAEKDIVGLLTDTWKTFALSATSTADTATMRLSLNFDTDNSSLGTDGRTSMWDNVKLYWATLADTNPILRVTDGQLAQVSGTTPLHIDINARDADSGLSRGTTSAATQTFVSVTTLATNNVAQYSSGSSSADSTALDSSNVWSWTSVGSIDTYMTGSNIIITTLRDTDTDRDGDRLSVSNITAGYFIAIDDDTNYPARGFMRTQELLKNPGFETNGAYWRPDPLDDRVQITALAAESGSYGLLITNYSWEAGGLYAEQFVDVVGGQTYTLSVRARKEGACTAPGIYVKAEHWSSGAVDGSWDETNIIASLTTNWQTFTLSFVAHASATSNKIVFMHWAGGAREGYGSVYFDNASFKVAVGPPMGVRVGSTYVQGVRYDGEPDESSNALYNVTDGDMVGISAGNPLRIDIAAYDADSGLARTNVNGTYNTNTFITVANLTTNNTTNFVFSESTPNPTTSTDTNTWRWNLITAATLDSMLAAVTNPVRVTMKDADYDRATDQLSVSNQLAGYIRVIDDDSDYPLGGNLLSNPGFEIGDVGSGAQPSNWWYYGHSGNENWSEVRSGTNCYGFWSWDAGWYAGFGQDVYVNLDNGDVVTFTIWGCANTGFTSTNSEAWIKIEFWTGGSLTHVVTNDIYAQLIGNYGTMTEYRLTCTNTADGITLVKPIVGSGGWAGSASVAWDDASFSVQAQPLIVSVDGYYASMIDDSFDGLDITHQWYWEAEYNTKAGVNYGFYMWPTGAFTQAAIGSRHSYPWVNNCAYTYQFTIDEMFADENFFVSLFLVGDDAGVQPYPYSDYNNPNVLMLQVMNFGSVGVPNWGVKLYLKIDSPFVTAYNTGDPGVTLLAETYSLDYVTNTTFGFVLDQTNLTLFVSSADDDITIVTNLTAAQVAHFSDQAYVHVGGRNDNGAPVSGEQAILSNVRVIPANYGADTFDYVLTDGDLAYVDSDNPLRLTFPGYDVDSGLSRGTTAASTQMYVTVVNLATNNVANYYASESSAFNDTILSSATSVWRWTDVTSDQIQSLMNASANPIRATLRDADFDRTTDQLSLTNVQFGQLRVIDDDTDYPRFSGMNVPGGSRTNLRAGDIVVVGYQSATPDKFSFVPLVDLVGGTVVKFTDCGWYSTGGFRSGEGMIIWTSPATWVAAGTVVTITNADAATPIPSVGTLSKVAFGGSFDLAASSGDELLVYQDTASSTTFLYAVCADDAGWSEASTANNTALPTGLTDGINAVNIGSGEYDNGYYSGSVHGGSTYSLANSISTASGWTTSDSILTWDYWCSVFNPDVYVEFSDESFGAGISITGLVSDGLSGLYRIQNGANSPTATVYNSSGTATYGAYFTNGPTSDGAGQADQVSLAVSDLIMSGDLSSVVTVKVVVTDYDVDRAGDSISSTQLVMVKISGDDDVVPGLPGTFQPGNLLRNPGFEWQHEGGTVYQALYWTEDLVIPAYMHGGCWGTASRESWGGGYPGGSYEGTIRGTWCGAGADGGYWQEVTNEMGAGAVWEASAWVWNNAATWTCAWQAIFVEFWDAGSSNMLSKTTNLFSNPGETWTRVAVTAAAPAGAVFARWVIGAWGVGPADALAIDNVSLRVVTNTAMDFMIGPQSYYRSGYGSNALFRVTDGDLASVSGTNLMKFVFSVYDPDSGLLRATTNEDLNYDIGSESQLQNFYSNYSASLSSPDTTIGSSTSVFVHASNFTISGPNPEPPGQTGMVWALMGFQNPGVGWTNSITLSGPDADLDRAYPSDVSWFTNSLYGQLAVTDDDTDGPFHWLIYVGDNYTWGSSSTNPISDEQMLNGFDFAYGIWDQSGLIVSNMAFGSTNIDGQKGQVAPNWDLVRPAPDSTEIVMNGVPGPTNIYSPKGNGSYNATVVVHNVSAVTYAQNTVGVWQVQTVAEDLDWDRGGFLRTNDQAIVETCSWDRAVSSEYNFEFTVYDDDTNKPLVTANANDRPLGVWIGASNVSAGATMTTNAVFHVTDGNLATLGGTNLVQNYSFESGNFAHWDWYGQDWRTSDNSADVHGGSWGMVNEVLTNWLNDVWRVRLQNIPAVAGEVYSASCYLRTLGLEDTNSESYMEVQFMDSGYNVLAGASYQSAIAKENQAFTMMTVNCVTAPVNTAYVCIRAVVHVLNTNMPVLYLTGTDWHIFDDFMLKKGDQPLKLVFSAYDEDSGMSRPGWDTNKVMNVDVGSWVANNTVNFEYDLSTGNSADSAATNIWQWENLNPYDIDVLYQGGSNKVVASLLDSDDDRINDIGQLPEQQFGYLYVTDDDTNAPNLRDFAFGGHSLRGLIVATNLTSNGSISGGNRTGAETNTIYRVTDGYIANLSGANPLYLAIGAIDTNSGIARGTEGETNTITVLSIGNQIAGSSLKTSYDSALSSLAGPNVAATNVWTLDDDPDMFTDTTISNLVTAGTTTVFATLVDSDEDRPSDQSVIYTQQVGFLAVIDDDTAGPNFSAMRYNGETGTTDDSLRQNGLSITGLIQDASGVWGGNAITLQLYSPTTAIWGTLYMTNPVVSNGAGVTATPVGKNSVQIGYGDRILGTWTAVVSATDNDYDGWTGDNVTINSNITFQVTDEDTAVPALTGLTLAGKTNEPTADLFISEYVEGDSNNKAVEIYNGTAAAIDLLAGQYRLQSYNNGSAVASFDLALSGTIAAGDVYLVYHGSTTSTVILAQGDQSATLSYNGNDAIVLRKGGSSGTILDIIGQMGSDPGATGWGTDPVNTTDNTIRRQPFITIGYTSTTFNASQFAYEWSGYARDTFEGLGSHVYGNIVLTDGDLASASLTVTGNVQDVGNGIYAIGADAPHYTIKAPGGTTIVNNDTFSQAPASDGDAKSTAEPISDTISGFTYGNIALGMHTAVVVLVDYDDDRPNDRLTNSQAIAFNVVDDDTNAPAASNLEILSGGILANTTNLTDGQTLVGTWFIGLHWTDPNRMSTSSAGDWWAPNYSLINPAGYTCLVNYAMDAFSTSDNTNYSGWRGQAGMVNYTNNETGVWRVVYSVQDQDNDRSGDWMATTNNSNIAGTSNLITVLDDDGTAPMPPTNFIVSVLGWTNVNLFTVAWNPAKDASGILEYRACTNGTPPAITNGVLLTLGIQTTNDISAQITNGNFETATDELQVPTELPGTNSWLAYGDANRIVHFDSAFSQSGAYSMRQILSAGLVGQTYVLIGQDVDILNTNNAAGVASLSAAFHGNLSASAYGDYCGGFMKIEFYDYETNSTGVWIENEWGNGRPLWGINTGAGWTNITLIATNVPPATKFIRFLLGLNSFNSKLAATGWWDNVTCTIKLVSASCAYGVIITNAVEGANTQSVYAVDADDDRPNDKMMSIVTNFPQLYDKTPPLTVTNVVIVEGTNDSTSEIILRWSPLPNGGGNNLSPWRTYAIYYTDQPRDPTNTDPCVIWTNGYPTLNNNTTTNITLTNFSFGTTYRLAMQGRDEAGNMGPLSSSEAITLSGFSVTQGVVLVTQTNGPAISWTATNSAGQIVRAFDLLYVDAMDFSDALSTQWKLLTSVVDSCYTDTGSVNRTPPWQMINTMRFYRAAQHDQWLTNRTPRAASVEIYGLKTIRIFRGQNWVALPFIPDSNSVKSILGYNLPGGTLYTDTNATKAIWYNQTYNQTPKTVLWLCKSAATNWIYQMGGTVGHTADNMAVSLTEGFVIQVPTNGPRGTNVLLFVGRVPTNTVDQLIQEGSSQGCYNVVSFRGPRRMHPSEMNLSGVQGASYSTYGTMAPMMSERIWSLNRSTQRGTAEAWYDTSTGRWRLNITPSFPDVPANYFGPDDGLVIHQPAGRTGWMWTLPVPYTPPTKNMTP